MLNKNTLRRDLLVARQAIAMDCRCQWDAAIGAYILNWWGTHPVRTLGVYWPIRGEPDLRPIYTELVAHGVQLALPAVMDRQAPLRFIAWTPGAAMTKDACGVAIPAMDNAVYPEAILIPCVGFNTEWIRLGYGGGTYDRTLARSPRPFAIGVSYALGRTVFDAEAHDVPLDMVITEEADAPAMHT